MLDQYIVLPEFPRELFHIGPFAVRWYALSYIVGLIFGWWYARRLVADKRLWPVQPGTPMQIDDLLVWVTLGVVLGGRLGDVLLYQADREYYFANPWEIPQVWHGGMAFHGGLIGAVLAIILFAWRNKIPILSYLDIAGAVAPPGIFLVRIANFINGELWGRETDVPWAMIFPDPNAGGVPRHPSQFYEAATEGILLFCVVFALTRMGALKRPGLIAGAFGLGYAAARSFSELFREPDGWAIDNVLTTGQAYSLPMAIVGLGLIIHALMRKPQPA